MRRAPFGQIGGIEDQFLSPHQSRISTLVDHRLEKAAKYRQAQASTNLTQRGMVGEWLVKVVPQVPAMRRIEAGDLDQLALGAQPLEEHDQVQFVLLL